MTAAFDYDAFVSYSRDQADRDVAVCGSEFIPVIYSALSTSGGSMTTRI